MQAATDSVPVTHAVSAAAEVVDHVLDRAVARVTGRLSPATPRRLAATVRELVAEPDGPLDAERTAASQAAGVTLREVSGLADAPGLPQTLLRSCRDGTEPRARTLLKAPVWQLAGLMAASSAGAARRAETVDAWLRASFLLVGGRVTIEPHGTRCLWTLVHREAQTAPETLPLTEIAAGLARGAGPVDFAGAILCCEHARKTGIVAEDVANADPLAAIFLAGAPRYRFTMTVPKPHLVPDDFHHIVFSESAEL